MTHEKYGIFVHALHKSATMFLYKLFKDLSKEAGILYYSLNNKPVNHDDLKEDIDESFCYCPVRHFADSPESVPKHLVDKIPDFFLEDNFVNVSKIHRIYQIRDPRDILVSEYFSYGFIHDGKMANSPKRKRIQQITIDEYCLKNANDLYSRYQRIFNIAKKNNPNNLLIKYESMVLDYKNWLSEIIALLPFQDKPEIIEKFYNKYREEFDTEGFEETMQHKRKMIPGDYQEKLKGSTIKELNSKFSDIIEAFYSE